MSTLTTGNDYFVLVASIRSDTSKTRTIGLTDLFIIPWYLFSYLLFVSIEMREKLHSQHETVISLPKSWDFKIFNLYLFYNNYKRSYTTYINHACWHRCLRSDGLCVGANRSAQRKPTCLTWWPHDHLTCRRRVLNRQTVWETWWQNIEINGWCWTNRCILVWINVYKYG